ncbi:MAG: site-specific integrase [Rubripirellula sp.]|nr:site-specific integrase [Rubripirellula sp.]
MPRPRSTQPKYQFHISGQARVELDYQVFYLGPHDSPESRARYHELLAIYNANGQRMPKDTPTHLIDAPVTVRTITGEFREHAKKRYANNPKELNRFSNLCARLEDDFGSEPADEFGPRLLSQVRDDMVGERLSRKYVNRLIRGVKKIFKHAVSMELVDVNVVIKLDTLEPLRAGQTEAHETEDVEPVDLDIVQATAKHLSPILKAMIGLQAATGMRPSEVCNLRPCDIEKRDDGVWLYRPPKHKTAHRGKKKAVPIVGDTRITIGPYLDRDPEAFCFSPRESMTWYRAEQRKNRKTKVQPSQTHRKKHKPKRQPGEQYKSGSYYQAIRNSAKKANQPHWFPYQLRHAAATTVREALGIEAAAALLGHARTDMTDHYAQQAIGKAVNAGEYLATLATKG